MRHYFVFNCILLFVWSFDAWTGDHEILIASSVFHFNRWRVLKVAVGCFCVDFGARACLVVGEGVAVVSSAQVGLEAVFLELEKGKVVIDDPLAIRAEVG